MSIKRKIISFILTAILIMSFTAFAFADDSIDDVGSDVKNQVSATIQNGDTDGTNNTCFWAGTVTLTDTSGRILGLEGETIAYHTVNKLGFTLYLQRKATSAGTISTVATCSYDATNAQIAYKAYGKKVSSSGYYRIRAVFNTVHTIHGTEGGSTYTSWMWVD